MYRKMACFFTTQNMPAYNVYCENTCKAHSVYIYIFQVDLVLVIYLHTYYQYD